MNGLKNGIMRLVNILMTTVSIRLLLNWNWDGAIEGFAEAAEGAEMSSRPVS